ncbi:hypothetical protein [Kitasatospora kifunensis]|uniref:Uncharacterized protein n=1 Tax=Kitasatospora kifunensis TaxID=58351 RepID=A0A7W7VY32_KITKI|nr:hypothetical protein [Kitasatospora kifunensis]MBB4926264.1 hypothetical protein [Kitasatospora kifunensis]
MVERIVHAHGDTVGAQPGVDFVPDRGGHAHDAVERHGVVHVQVHQGDLLYAVQRGGLLGGTWDDRPAVAAR